MELTQQVEEVLKRLPESSQEQAEQINAAVKIVNDLVRQGLMEPPSYRLADTSSPSRVFAFNR